jgi:hypothetical protein
VMAWTLCNNCPMQDSDGLNSLQQLPCAR